MEAPSEREGAGPHHFHSVTILYVSVQRQYFVSIYIKIAHRGTTACDLLASLPSADRHFGVSLQWPLMPHHHEARPSSCNRPPSNK